MDEWPKFRLEVRRVDGRYSWVVDLQRQEKKYGKWVTLNTGGGRRLSEALAAVQYGCTRQEKEHPELW